MNHATSDAAFEDFCGRVRALTGGRQVFVRAVIGEVVHVFVGPLRFNIADSRYHLLSNSSGEIVIQFAIDDVDSVILAGYLELKPIPAPETWPEIVGI